MAFNEFFFTTSPIRERVKRGLFYGMDGSRNKVISSLKSWLETRINPSEPAIGLERSRALYLLVGTHRIGKTSLLYHTIDLLSQEKNQEWPIIYLNQVATKAWANDDIEEVGKLLFAEFISAALYVTREKWYMLLDSYIKVFKILEKEGSTVAKNNLIRWIQTALNLGGLKQRIIVIIETEEYDKSAKDLVKIFGMVQKPRKLA